jgi:hypothetical protein
MAEVSTCSSRAAPRTPATSSFILARSVLSLANSSWSCRHAARPDNQRTAIFIIDGALSVTFLADFASRLLGGESKRSYFMRGGGWLDLIGSLPTPRVAPIFHVLCCAGRLLREHGFRTLAPWLVRERAQSTLDIVGSSSSSCST